MGKERFNGNLPLLVVLNLYIGQMSNNIFVPKKGADLDKIKKIRNALRKNPQGLWIREIARRTGISKSTVHIYVNKYMVNEIEDVVKVRGNLIRFVRLKE